MLDDSSDGIDGVTVTVSGLGVTGETAMHTNALGDCTFGGLKLKNRERHCIPHVPHLERGDTEVKVPVVMT